MVKTHPGAADRFAVGTDASKNEHARSFQPLREQLRVLVASALHRPFALPSADSDLLFRVVLREGGLPFFELGRSHPADRHLRHGAMLPRC